MPITILGPDNTSVEFPDGTDTPTIQKAMAAHFGAPAPAPGAAPTTLGLPQRAQLDEPGAFDLGGWLRQRATELSEPSPGVKKFMEKHGGQLASDASLATAAAAIPAAAASMTGKALERGGRALLPDSLKDLAPSRSDWETGFSTLGPKSGFGRPAAPGPALPALPPPAAAPAIAADLRPALPPPSGMARLAAPSEQEIIPPGAPLPPGALARPAGEPPLLPPPGGGTPPPGGAAPGAGPPPPLPERGAAIVQSLSPEARAMLKAADERAGITAPEHVAEIEANAHPETMFGEVAPSLQADMGAIAGPTGTAKNEITQALNERAKAAPARLDAMLTDTFGAYQDPGAIKRQLKLQQSNTASPLYKLWNETPVAPTPTLEALVPRLKAAGALQAAAKNLQIEGLPATQRFALSAPAEMGGRMLPVGRNTLSSADLGIGPAELAAREGPTARAFDEIKGHLDNQISLAIKNGDGRAVRRYTQLKNDLVTAIDNHPDANVAGIWKQGREKFAAPARVDEAVSLGQKFFDPRVRLDELQQRFESAAPAEIQGLISGVRADAAHRLEGSARGDANLRSALSSTEARRKIEWLVGRERAYRFAADIEHEASFPASKTQIVGGSQTQPRVEAAKNWTVQPSAYAEKVRQFIKPEHVPWVLGAEAAGSMMGMPGAVTGAAIGTGSLIANRRAAAAERAMEKIRNEVARVMVLRGADRASARRELLNGGKGGAPGAAAMPGSPPPPPRSPGSLSSAGREWPKLPGGAQIVEHGPHGPAVEGLQGRWKEAVAWLREAQSGDARGVLAHPDVPGRIDVLWGNRKGGLQHILEKHPEVAEDLPERLARMRVTNPGQRHLVLASPDGKENAVVAMDYAGGPKTWLLTAYERRAAEK